MLTSEVVKSGLFGALEFKSVVLDAVPEISCCKGGEVGEFRIFSSSIVLDLGSHIITSMSAVSFSTDTTSSKDGIFIMLTACALMRKPP